jgi:hypothetical protein
MIVCPVCTTTFDPRASGGRCPLCGEQLVEQAALVGEASALSPAWRWFTFGGWRLVLVVLFVLYELMLFLYVWHGLVVNDVL